MFVDSLSNSTHLGIEQAYFLAAADIQKRMYYLTPDYVAQDDTYVWQLYLSLVKLKPKHIIIGIDLGVTSNKLFNIEKAVGKFELFVVYMHYLYLNYFSKTNNQHVR